MASFSQRTFRQGNSPSDMSIEWEFMPSMRNLLKQHDATVHGAAVWADTMPSGFDESVPSEFHEPLPGLTLREVTEPEVFNAYFGQRSA